MSESDFLALQATRAREAMGQALHQMADALKEGTDPRAWVQQYPLISMGAAAALGFLAASAVTPSREETLKERLRELFPEAPAAQPPVQVAAAETSARHTKSSAWMNMASPLLDALKTALVSAVSSTITAKTHQQASETVLEKTVERAAPQGGQASGPMDPAAAV